MSCSWQSVLQPVFSVIPAGIPLAARWELRIAMICWALAPRADGAPTASPSAVTTSARARRVRLDPAGRVGPAFGELDSVSPWVMCVEPRQRGERRIPIYFRAAPFEPLGELLESAGSDEQ